MNKHLKIILCIIMLISISMPFLTYANTSFAEGEADLLQEDVYNSSLYSNMSLSLNDTALNNLKNAIKSSLKSSKSSFSVSTYKVLPDDFQIIYSGVINDNPELFYVSSTYSYSISNSTGYVAIVYPEYAMTNSEITTAKVIYENGINKAISQVDDTMSDVQKALVIHDYLANISTYPDLGDSNENDKASYHSAYGIFLDGYTVCAGYTLTYSDIMHRLGIPCKYVISDEMGHAWNAIQINGNWYNVDLTFDEMQLIPGTNNKGTVLHNCFMKSDAGIKSKEGVGHYGIIYPDGVSCDDTSYDEYFWHGVNTNIFVDNGNYYYLDFDNSSKNLDLIQRDGQGNEQKLNNNKYISYSVNPTSSTIVGTVSYIVPFSKLIKANDILYFSYVNNGAKIGAYDIKNSIEYSVVLSHDNYNFGLDIKDNVISYSTFSDRYNYIEFSLLDDFNDNYNSSKYNPYSDINNDKIINSKDYVYITKK